MKSLPHALVPLQAMYILKVLLHKLSEHRIYDHCTFQQIQISLLEMLHQKYILIVLLHHQEEIANKTYMEIHQIDQEKREKISV